MLYHKLITSTHVFVPRSALVFKDINDLKDNTLEHDIKGKVLVIKMKQGKGRE